MRLIFRPVVHYTWERHQIFDELYILCHIMSTRRKFTKAITVRIQRRKIHKIEPKTHLLSKKDNDTDI